jgi:chemotaxis response regulator CheB
MEQIYLIEDCNGLKYVGRTKLKLNKRFSVHKSDKKRGVYCSSSKLNLDSCDIICIDSADSKEEAHQLEKFYINAIDCVNDCKLNYDPNNRSEYMRDYHKKIHATKRKKTNPRKIKMYHYQKTWGGDKRSENNLLMIDINLLI